MSDQMSNQEDASTPDDSDAPWGIKSIASADRKAALAAAKRANRTVGEWLGEAIRHHIASEREDRSSAVLAPATGQALAVVAPGAEPSPTPSLDEIEQAVRLSAQIAELRGTPLKPNSRVLVAAQRLLAQRIVGRA